MKHCNRKFIIAGMCISFCLSLLCGCSRQAEKVTKVGTAMGTVVQETLYVTDMEAGQNAAQEMISKIERLEQESLSWRMEGSEVAGINAKAGEAAGALLSVEMQADLEQIWEVSKKSGGALDVTVGQVTGLWDLDTWAVADAEAQKAFREPEQEALQGVLANTGYEKVSLEGERIYLPMGMSLDLGAVGKGIACDRIGDYLETCEDITGAVISVGGSIVTYGNKPDGSNWNVAIVHPREEGAYLGTLSLQGEWYVSTSGDYERYVEKDGIRYHHIMNPKTGYPADSGVCSVTILSDNGLLSDALSTACFVLGLEDGMKLAEEFDVEALFVTEELEVFGTEGMEVYFVGNSG
ncbi:MAG: FAD:protein FMN transferase [Lachnospiraceae bacterium]|nr:FAD:protein FMN transferase [Lachnospiraceae bacterium]